MGLGERDLPAVNACLNAVCTVLLLTGYVAIKQRRVALHKCCMLTAFAVSAVFLASYLYYHIVVMGGKSTRFAERNPDAPAALALVYYTILWSHIVLAVVALPLELVTTYFGLRGRLDRHVRLARWTFPIWLYVSITGVVVYWLLYRLYPPG
jgi:putative membrane protein